MTEGEPLILGSALKREPEIGVAEKYETTVVFHANKAQKKYIDRLKGW